MTLDDSVLPEGGDRGYLFTADAHSWLCLTHNRCSRNIGRVMGPEVLIMFEDSQTSFLLTFHWPKHHIQAQVA